MKKIVINGFGRIGRLAFRELIGSKEYKVVGINGRGTSEEMAYLLKYDSAQGGFEESSVSFTEEGIIFEDELIKTYQFDNPEECPWKELDVDCVLECTGAFTKYEDAYKHIKAGAKHVVISAPGKGDMKTIVFGVNDNELTGDEEIISAASCTTNCLTPVLRVIDHYFGIESGFMSTIHALTNDQNILDGSHKKGITSRRGRAAVNNIIPTSTGAASAVGKVLPNLDGKLDGLAFRVPVVDGSCVDLTLNLKMEVTKEMINNAFKSNTNVVLKYTDDPVVSSDVIGNRCGSLVDGSAGLTISEKMRKQIRGLDKASSNAQDGVSSVQTAEGALTEVHSMLQRMNELAVQSANGTNSSDDRQAIQDEVDQLTTEIDRVAETTKFNEIYLLKGDNSNTKNVYMKGHDAGLKGTLTDGAKSATFTMDALQAGDKYTIAGKEYTIGSATTEVTALIDKANTDATADTANKTVDVNGKTYTITYNATVAYPLLIV